MNQTPRHKIIHPVAIRIALAVAGIALTALLGMIGSMQVAERLEGDAAAINIAGSLRMQSYRLVNVRIIEGTDTSLPTLISSYEASLSHRLLRQNVQQANNHQLNVTLGSLHEFWGKQLKPALLLPSAPAPSLSQMADQYVSQIDVFVRVLQLESESKISNLRSALWISILVLVIISATSLIGVWNILEERVERKTHLLRLSNESLRILYESSQRLFAKPDAFHTAVPDILREIQNITQSGTISLCFRKSDDAQAFRLITSDGSEKPNFCCKPHCEKCPTHKNNVVNFPVACNNLHVGDINVQLQPHQSLPEWQQYLFSALSEILATTISLQEANQNASRIALLNERTAIARELHDSLAQALSYQKMQTSRFRKLLEKSAKKEDLHDTIDAMQDGLNNAYRQLRELISTFRINVASPGLVQALQHTIDEFSDRVKTPIHLKNRIEHCPLTPNEEIHSLQIIREALNNATQHAQASQIQVRLDQLEKGNIRIQIEDDGIGIPEEPSKPGHYGLSILQERSQRLGGHIAFKTPPTGGTLIDVQFHPQFMNNDIKVTTP